MITHDLLPAMEAEEIFDPFLEAVLQFEEAAKALDLEDCIVQRLRHTERDITVNLTLVRDNGQAVSFTGMRVQHNASRGPALGGVRLSPEAHLSQIKAQAMNLTWQCALLDLPFGGSAGALVCDPQKLSERELRCLVKDYVGALRGVLSPTSDVIMQDVGSNQRILAWMLDGYARMAGHLELGAVVGKPPVLFGLPDHADATATGLLHVLEQALEEERRVRGRAEPGSTGAARLSGLRVSIQGLGKMGLAAAQLLHDAGARVVAVADVSGGAYRPDGIDVPGLTEWMRHNRALFGYPEAEAVSNAELLEADCDVLILAAIERQITLSNAERIRASLVLEVLQDAVTRAATSLLEGRGVKVVPHLIAGSGAIVAAYLEWSRNVGHEGLLVDGIEEHLQRVLQTTYHQARKQAQRRGCSLGQAAYLLGVEKTAAALRLR